VENQTPSLLFAKAVVKHWAALITGGVAMALLTIWQNTGHRVAPSVYWSIAIVAMVFAFYRAWFDEHQGAMRLGAELAQQAANHQEAVKQRQEALKKDLLRALTALNGIEPELLNWMDVSLDKYGMPPPGPKWPPDDWPTVAYAAGCVSPELRKTADALEHCLTEANSLISRFLSMPVTYRDARLMATTHKLLVEAVPLLSTLQAQLRKFEGSVQ
jgi:hypothetical protein